MTWLSDPRHYGLLFLLLSLLPWSFSLRLLVLLDIHQDAVFLNEVMTPLRRLTTHPGHQVHLEMLCSSRLDLHSARLCRGAKNSTAPTDKLQTVAVATRCRELGCQALLFLDSDVFVRHPDHLVDRLLSIDHPEAVVTALVSPQTSAVPLRSEKLFLVHRTLLDRLPVSLPLLTAVANEPWVAVLASHAGLFLVSRANPRKDHIRPELWQMFNNPKLWEMRYLHPDYRSQLRPEVRLHQPCRDVFRIQLFSRNFCNDLIAEMEVFGKWSRGEKHNNQRVGADPRRVDQDLNYATVDVLLWQIEFHFEYMWILKRYLTPIQHKVYPGYFAPPYTFFNFVVRYHQGEQVELKPHFDESMVSLNLALNDEGKDYRGGGTRFGRYNCSVVGLPSGSALFHPSRPTHIHQGLRLLNGTRYILVSFLDGSKYMDMVGDPFGGGRSDPFNTCLRVSSEESLTGW